MVQGWSLYRPTRPWVSLSTYAMAALHRRRALRTSYIATRVPHYVTEQAADTVYLRHRMRAFVNKWRRIARLRAFRRASRSPSSRFYIL